MEKVIKERKGKRGGGNIIGQRVGRKAWMQMEKQVKWKVMKNRERWFAERRVRKKYRTGVTGGIRDA